LHQYLLVIFKDLFVGLNTDIWGNSLYIHPTHSAKDLAEYVPLHIKLLPVVVSIVGVIASYIYIRTGLYITFNFTSLGHNLYFFFNNKWYFDTVYNYFLVRPTLYLGHRVFSEIIDRGFLELLGPAGIIKITLLFVKKASLVHSGYIYHYMFLFLLGLCLPALPVFTPSILIEVTDLWS